MHDALTFERETATTALDNIILGLEKIQLGLNSLKQLSSSEAFSEDLEFNPRDPANKYEVGGLEKLTEQGIEVCYRLFDLGKTRYAVSTLMDISFGAASHRLKAWEKAGGANRTKKSLKR
jgi:hypothetical protein